MSTPTPHSNSEIVPLDDVNIEQPNLNLSQKPDQPRLSLKEKLDAWCPVQHDPTIYKLRKELRNMRSEAYDPSMIAIGPYHSHRENLKEAEIHKLAYLRSFLDREKKSIEDCVALIERLEPKARKCYAETISLNPTEFVEMLILDGCFIIEFALRYNYPILRQPFDHIFSRAWVEMRVVRDLLLFENQIPFFILSELFDDNKLVPCLLKIYPAFSWLRVKPHFLECPHHVKHLLELFHKSLVAQQVEEKSEETSMCMDGEMIDFNHSATSLAEYDVLFEPAKEEVSTFQVTFKNGSMRLTHLRVVEDSESYFRNLIAYEEYFPGETNPMGDYVKFMDSLINSPEDVKLLTDCGIIDNWLGSEKNVADMFNRLCQHVTIYEDFVYRQQFKKVKEHCNRKRNRWMAKLKQNHFNSPWAIISIIAASVLLVLTSVQTLFTVIN